MRTLVEAETASDRLRRAAEWLAARAPAEEVVVVAATADAANEIIRRTVTAGRSGASFGWHRVTLGRLAAELARPALIDANLVPVGSLPGCAVVARVVHECDRRGELGRYAQVAGTPGFARAAAAAIDELRMARVAPERVGEASPELRRLLEATDEELVRAQLADRAAVFELATRAARDRALRHPLLGLPLLLLDVSIATRAEEELLGAMVERAPEAVATVPAGDARTRRRALAIGLEAAPAASAPPPRISSLAHLQRHVFLDVAPPAAAVDGSVVVLSAPGESREAVEIARRLVGAARRGIPFDRMAVLLRSPEEYRPHLEEALARAGVPAAFARGAVRPDPAGRAFVALLACAAERLSARRFAEYLSLGVVPDATAAGAPPPAAPVAERWVAPDEEMVPEAIADALAGAAPAAADVGEPALPVGAHAELGASGRGPTEADVSVADPEEVAVVAGTLRAPRRWEQLLVDAAVIGGRERWRRRLDGLEAELGLDLAELEDDASAARIRRTLADLGSLRDFALPLLDELAELPESADWGRWIERLSALATRALRDPTRVLQVLSELEPMAPVGPVALREVQLVLSQRLLELALPPPRSRYGRVFVGPVEAARGLAFDLVCIPGLAEKLFPREIREEPLLLDRVRERLSPDLPTNDDRVQSERLALRIAVGAAERELVLSYPRLDMEKARPRVPSFYTLEAMRAAQGRLPGFAELGDLAERVADARVGWPAPRSPENAIDEAEHDLALLDRLLRLEPAASVGTARFLLDANPHLGRALRFRARRWLRRWTPADGLVEPIAAAREALARHALAARSYSATALENYAACPYHFFLQAVHRLAPREEPAAIDEMDALQRGALVHDVQFALFQRLQARGLLPVVPSNLASARAELDDVLEAVAGEHHERLAPAIERVWSEGIAGIRADLREWLRRMSEDESGFVPWRFELAFGLASRRNRDSRSIAEAVELEAGIRLRGSIDLVERDAAGRVRVTDHKTGKVKLGAGGVLAGGSVLQPVLYALAAEKLFPDATVTESRLSYCTSAGGFTVRPVELDERVRQGASALADAVGAGLSEAFLPALPAPRACRFCDYRVVCGPYEEMRTERKPKESPALAALRKLRELA